MNLGAKPEFQTIANINLGTPIGSIMSLQGFALGENPEESEVKFEAVLAKASLENEQSVESSKISPQENSPISLEQTLGSLYPEADDVKISSPQINSDAVVDSPKLVEELKVIDSAYINHPSQVQELTVSSTEIENVFPNKISKKQDELQTEKVEVATLSPEVLEAVKQFEIENDIELSEAQISQAVASHVDVTATKPRIAIEETESIAIQPTQKTASLSAVAVASAPQAEIVIPVRNNLPTKATLKTDKKVEDLNSKTVIKTSLPVNIKDIELVQNESFFHDIESELSNDSREEKFISKVTAEPKEAVLLSQKPKEFAPILKIAHYQERGIPVENRSQNITHQVVKVLNNLETKTQSITVQLDPVELGKIDIKMEISPKGETKVQILADKLETYALLAKSSDQIQSILGEKGLNQDSTSLNFGLRNGNSNQQHSHQQFASANTKTGTTENDSSKIEISVAHLLYKDPNRLDITA